MAQIQPQRLSCFDQIVGLRCIFGDFNTMINRNAADRQKESPVLTGLSFVRGYQYYALTEYFCLTCWIFCGSDCSLGYQPRLCICL